MTKTGGGQLSPAMQKKCMEAARAHVEEMFATDNENSNSSAGNNNANNGISSRSSSSSTSSSRRMSMSNSNPYERQYLKEMSHLARLDMSSPILGKVLGKGGFATVKEIRGFKKVMNDSTRSSSGSLEFLVEHCLRAETGDARYALKALSRETVRDKNLFSQGIVDMAVEAHFLSTMAHPNIVKVRGLAKTPDGTPFSSPDYFIVLDRLYDTLDKRFATWKTKLMQITTRPWFNKEKRDTKLQELYEERIVAAYDLSDALNFLHKRQIVYRDIKPDNIGFNIRNDIELFDFGMAKELRMAKQKYSDGTYKLTPMTGTPHYMAPENGLDKPYNEKCDVFSFAILLWQFVALDPPYPSTFRLRTLKERVWVAPHKRPYLPKDNKKGSQQQQQQHKMIDRMMTQRIQDLLPRSWCPNVQQRYSMEQVTNTLYDECVQVRDGNEAGLEHQRRRSTFVFEEAAAQIEDPSAGGGSSVCNNSHTEEPLSHPALPPSPPTSRPTTPEPSAAADPSKPVPTPAVVHIAPVVVPQPQQQQQPPPPPQIIYDDDDDDAVSV